MGVSMQASLVRTTLARKTSRYMWTYDNDWLCDDQICLHWLKFIIAISIRSYERDCDPDDLWK
jgi:hypothetical protein